ncbi:MAG: TetR/AcrR family transcriptional regulator [Actinomycetota bacterium]
MSARTRDPEAKRAAVLSAAIEAFTSDGFQGTSTAAIAAAAGVSEGIVFHHFGSKHGLLEACATSSAEAFITGELRTGHLERVDEQRLVGAIFDWVAGHPLISGVWAERDDRVIGALRRGIQRAVVQHVAARLDDEQAAGRCRPGDTTFFARLQFGVVGEALALHFAAADRFPRELVVAETARGVAGITRP